MIDEVTITNLSTNIEHTFDKENSEFLLDDNGVVIEELKSNFNTYAVYGRIGRLMDEPQLSSAIDITITGWIIHTMMTPLDDKKQQLVKFFNPLQELKLRFKNREIKGYSKTSPKFGASRKENNDLFCKFQVVIYCPNPSFKSTDIVRYGIQGTAPTPYYPPDGGIPLRLNGDDVVLIPYDGTIPAEMSLYFNPNRLIPAGTWTEDGARIQKLYVTPGTENYDLSKVVEEFATRSMTYDAVRLYTSNSPNPGWYSLTHNNPVMRFSEIDPSKPEFMHLDLGINALRLTTASGSSLSCYDIIVEFHTVYAYPREEWGN